MNNQQWKRRAFHFWILNYSSSPLRSYPNPSEGVHFNGHGTRLLCVETDQSAFSLYDLNSAENTAFMRLTAPGFRSPNQPNAYSNAETRACFAGRADEFVVGRCRATGRVYIWSTNPGPKHQHNDQVQPLVTLNHKGCSAVRYNESVCALGSVSEENFKMWTLFRLPDYKLLINKSHLNLCFLI